jgi:ribose 5-phosphate isomerase B
MPPPRTDWYHPVQADGLGRNGRAYHPAGQNAERPRAARDHRMATPEVLQPIAPRPCQTGPVRVYLGSDHAGFELKAALIEWLTKAGHEAVDCGPSSYDPADDYPPYVMRAAGSAVAEPGSLGIVIGGSGNGEQIASNKIRGVRAALAWSDETARLARLHNDANVLSLGAREYPVDQAVGFAKVFVETEFSQEARHARRLGEIADYEKSGVLPPLP